MGLVFLSLSAHTCCLRKGLSGASKACHSLHVLCKSHHGSPLLAIQISSFTTHHPGSTLFSFMAITSCRPLCTSHLDHSSFPFWTFCLGSLETPIHPAMLSSDHPPQSWRFPNCLLVLASHTLRGVCANELPSEPSSPSTRHRARQQADKR